MRSKSIDRDKMVEYKKRIDKHKKDIENRNETVEKAKTNHVVKDKTVEVAKDKTEKDKASKEITINKRKKMVKKKPSKEFIEEIKRRAEEKAYKGIVSEEELSEKEPKYYISKEERAERFKRLHELAVQMSNKWREENNNL